MRGVMLKSPKQNANLPFILACVIILSAGAVFFTNLHKSGLHPLDDAFYAQKAKEILKTGDMWVMRYDGRPNYHNPPAHMWIMALAYKAFGVSEFSARFSSALFMLMLMAALYALSLLMFKDGWAAFFAVFAAATTNFFTRFAVRGMLDITLVFFQVMSIYFFIYGMEKKKTWPYAAAGIFLGLCVLTKSLLGAYPAVVMLAYLFVTKKFRLIFSLKAALYVFSAAAVAFPWFALNYASGGQAFIASHFGEILSDSISGFDGKKLSLSVYYIKALFTYGLPWMPVAIAGSVALAYERMKKRGNSYYTFIVIWAWLIVIMLSFTARIKYWYIMPSIPAGMLIAGAAMAKWVKNPVKIAGVLTAIYLLAAAVIVTLPVKITSGRYDAVKEMAPAIRQVKPAGAPIINYGLDFWRIQNQLIFYADRNATLPVTGADAVFERMKKTGETCIAREEVFNMDFKKYYRYTDVIAKKGGMVLFRAAAENR